MKLNGHWKSDATKLQMCYCIHLYVKQLQNCNHIYQTVRSGGFAKAQFIR